MSLARLSPRVIQRSRYILYFYGGHMQIFRRLRFVYTINPVWNKPFTSYSTWVRDVIKSRKGSHPRERVTRDRRGKKDLCDKPRRETGIYGPIIFRERDQRSRVCNPFKVGSQCCVCRPFAAETNDFSTTTESLKRQLRVVTNIRTVVCDRSVNV